MKLLCTLLTVCYMQHFFLELNFACCHYLKHKEYLQCNIDTQFTNLRNLSLFLPVYLASHKAKDVHLADFEK